MDSQKQSGQTVSLQETTDGGKGIGCTMVQIRIQSDDDGGTGENGSPSNDNNNNVPAGPEKKVGGGMNGSANRNETKKKSGNVSSA